MKKIFTLSTLILLTIASFSQIVVNEVIFTPVPAIELKNLGTGTVNVSSYQLCSFPEYNELQELTLESGDLMLGPGELLVVTGHSFDISDDEMALYTNGAYTDPNSMLDYVEWGSTGHTRAPIAIMAGIWSSGSFVGVDAGGSSLEYDGEGNNPSDWLLNGTNSQGEENSNAGGECEATAFVVGSQSICEGSSATFQLILTGISPWTFTYSLDGVLQDPVTTSDSPFAWMLTEEGSYDLMSVEDANCEGDASGSVNVTFIDAPTAELSGESEFCASDPDAALSIDFTGQGPWTFDYAIDGIAQGESTVADNPTTIPITVAGAYSLLEVSNSSCAGTASGSVEVVFSTVLGGTLTHMGAISPVTVCVDDDFPDPLTFDLEDEEGEVSAIIITDEDGIIVELPGSNIIDFDGSEAGNCIVWNASFVAGLEGLSVGEDVADLDGCFDFSNPITVIRQTGADCVTSVDEFDGLQELMIYPNPVQDRLSIRYTLDQGASLNFSILDMTGKIVLNQTSTSYGGADITVVDVSVLNKGAYILQMSSTAGGRVQRVFMK